jgi:hypothetical protein
MKGLRTSTLVTTTLGRELADPSMALENDKPRSLGLDLSLSEKGATKGSNDG